LEDWANAAASYANVLTVYPDAGEAYRTASDHLHETLFDFPQAFILNQQWLERHPEDHSAWRALAERPCTTGRFAKGEQRIAALLANPAVEPRVHIALQAIQIAALRDLGKADLIPEKIEALIEGVAKQPVAFRVDGSFTGTRYFVSHDAALVP
jgi:hypothetical protein